MITCLLPVLVLVPIFVRRVPVAVMSSVAMVTVIVVVSGQTGPEGIVLPMSVVPVVPKVLELVGVPAAEAAAAGAVLAAGVVVLVPGRGAAAADLVRLVAHDDDGQVGEVARLVDGRVHGGDVLERVGVQQVVHQHVSVGVAQAITWK